MSSNSDIGIGDLLEHICELEMENKYLKRSIDGMGKIIVQLNAKLTNHQWISVTDRLPEKGVNVLVTDGKYFMVTWREFTLSDRALWINNTSDYADEKWGRHHPLDATSWTAKRVIV